MSTKQKKKKNKKKIKKNKSLTTGSWNLKMHNSKSMPKKKVVDADEVRKSFVQRERVVCHERNRKSTLSLCAQCPCNPQRKSTIAAAGC